MAVRILVPSQVTESAKAMCSVLVDGRLFAHLTLSTLSCGNIILPASFMEYRHVIALNGDCVPMPIS